MLSGCSLHIIFFQCDGDVNVLITEVTNVQNRITELKSLASSIDIISAAIATLKIKIESRKSQLCNILNNIKVQHMLYLTTTTHLIFF